MKNLLKALSIMIIPLMISCVEPQQREGAEGSLEIQGEEKVNAPLDTAIILPDTIIIN